MGGGGVGVYRGNRKQLEDFRELNAIAGGGESVRALQPEVEAEAEAALQCSAHFINAISVSARLESAEGDRER